MAQASQSADSSLSIDSVIRGHHVSKRHWTPRLGEKLIVEREPTNAFDKHAVAVLSGSTVVGHIPREKSHVSWHFLLHGGTITAEVIGKRKFGKGLEVPCRYTFIGKKKLVQKLKIFFDKQC
jgi:hypothetical protein